jgi:hypothetical protein
MAVFKNVSRTYQTTIHKSGANSTDLFTIDVIVPLFVLIRRAYENLLADNHKSVEARMRVL